jgi:hypothetical protein
MQVREHPVITERHLRQPYYFTRWYCCMRKHCRTELVMPKEFKVWTTQELPASAPELRPGDDIVLDVLGGQGMKLVTPTVTEIDFPEPGNSTKKQITAPGKLVAGRGALGIPGDGGEGLSA